MPVSCEQIQFEPLPPASAAEHYALHRAALEYSLIEPIVIHDGDDIKSKARWQAEFEPYLHQVQNLITFCRRLPVTLLVDDVGLGKTISAGLILGELMIRKRVSRALVLCPAILGPQWVEELAGKFNIPAVRAVGAEFASVLEHSRVPVIVTTYDTARNHFQRIHSGHFDMAILDEAHKLRNLHGAQNPPIMAQRVRSALEKRFFKYVLMLTATPIQNRVWDLYSLIDLLTVAKGHCNPFGDPDTFRQKFLADAAGRRLNPFRADEFRSILRQYVQRTRRGDAQLKFPERQVCTTRVPLDQGEIQLLSIVGQHISELNKLSQTSLAQAMMSSPQALLTQMGNMARNGTLPEAAFEEASDAAAKIQLTGKLNGLLALVRQLKAERPGDWRLVVFTIRKETQDAIGEALGREGIAVGYIRGGQARSNQSAIERLRSDPPQINVIVSTDAGAEGVNLQSANVLVNYDLPWNPMVVEQRIGRVQRLASKFENVVVVNLVGAGTVEDRVVGRLVEKLQAVAETIGDIEAILETTNMEGEGDERDSFESMIRELVVKSLIGQNVEQATAAARASIDQAKQVMANQRGEIDSTLGRLDGLQDLGPMLPKIKPSPPSLTPEQFVIRALTAEGAVVRPKANDTFDVIVAGRANEVITFKEEAVRDYEGRGVFMGNPPRLYLPGRPQFERLVQRWLQRSCHFITDLSRSTQELAVPIARDWCGWFEGAKFLSVETEAGAQFFAGRLVCRAKAATGVDSLEKLIEVRLAPEGHHALAAFEPAEHPLITQPVSAKQVGLAASAVAAEAVAADRDIVRFWNFYQQRQAEEQVKAEGDTRRVAKIEADFAPKVFSDVVAATGTTYAMATLAVRYSLDDAAEYVSHIKTIPATKQVIQEPQRKMCVLSQRRLPVDCLGQCVITGWTIVKHRLVSSEESGRTALEQYALRCEITGKLMLNDELAHSALSGKRGARSLFSSSPVSQRLGLEEDFAPCEITGVQVLKDELIESQVSGRFFRRDQAASSAVSGVLGHQSEFVICQASGSAILPSEAGRSDVSGKQVSQALLIRSQKPPGRFGLEEECVTCQVTGNKLLSDEVATSAASGKVVDKELLVRSEGSGELALPQELVCCELTQKRLLPQETAVSALSGKRANRALLEASAIDGRLGLADEMASCEVTGARVLNDELVKSEESGRMFRRDQIVASQFSGKVAHESETLICAASGKRMLAAEASVSAISGQSYHKSYLRPSDKPPGRLGVGSELSVCQASGQTLLIDELAQSAASGLNVDKALLVPSDESGALALPQEMVICAVTGERLLPCEAGTSAVSGRQVSRRLLAASPLDGRLGLAEEFELCEFTGTRVLRDELMISADSGKKLRRDQSATSEFSGKTGHKSEIVICSASGAAVLISETAMSAISGKRFLKDYLKPSDKSPERLGTDKELVTCCATGKRLLLDEAGRSAVTQKIYDKELLVRSERSGRRALAEELVVCVEKGAKLLPQEAGVCRLTGLTFEKDLLTGGEHTLLRQLLDGKVAGEDGSLWLPTLQQHPLLGAAKSARMAASATLLAACVELRTLLGFKVRYAGLLMRRADRPAIIGNVVIGWRDASGWRVETR